VRAIFTVFHQIGCIGDTVAQYVEKIPEWDLNRIIRVASWGTISAAPVFMWLRKLEGIVGGNTWRHALTKVTLHQAIASPIHNSLFYGYVGWWQTQGEEKSLWWDAWMLKLRNELITTQISACAVWFPANMLAFSFLPLRYRVVFQSLLGTLWMAYLSHIGHAEEKDETIS